MYFLLLFYYLTMLYSLQNIFSCSKNFPNGGRLGMAFLL